MAINLVTAPTGGAPLSTADYNAQNQYLQTLIKSLDQNQLHLTEWDTMTAPKIAEDVFIQHGGVLFQVESADEIIGSGSPSSAGKSYIRLSQTNSTLNAEWEADISGYSWNNIYNGFYNVSDQQILPYIIYYTDSSDLYKYRINRCEDIYDLNSKLLIREEIALGTWNMVSTPAIIFAYSDILSTLYNDLTFDEFCERIINYSANIINDANTSIKSLEEAGNIDIFSPVVAERFYFNRDASGIFNHVDYDGAANRGYFILEYWI